MTKVLVIEDEDLIREVVVNLLNAQGFTAIGAEFGSRGLQLAKEFVPDIIFCDVKMPGMDGYEVLRLLRSEPSTADIPFIFLSAQSTSQDVLRQGKILGANGYLNKPFTTNELLEAIAKHLKN